MPRLLGGPVYRCDSKNPISIISSSEKDEEKSAQTRRRACMGRKAEIRDKSKEKYRLTILYNAQSLVNKSGN